MYNFLAKHIFAPSLDIARGTRTMQKLKELERSQWWPRDKVLQFQGRRLRQLLQHSCDNVPFYRRIFDERSLRPSDINTVKELVELPVLTKKLIRDNFDNLVAANFPAKQRVRLFTSGSTGEPLAFYGTKEDHVSIAFGAAQRNLSGMGIEIGDRMLSLSIRYEDEPSNRAAGQLMIDKFRRRLVIYARDLLQSDMSSIARKIEQFNPALIQGCPTSVYSLARFLQGDPGYNIRPKAILVGSEQLFDYQRQLFRDVFECEIYDRYGAEEQHTIAFQCREASGYHIAAENTVVEVVDDNNYPVPAGEKGRVLITNLNNYAMPFIRYDIGDVAVASEKSCRCGRGLPMIASLEGRSTDVITTKTRGKISGNYLFYPAYPTLAHLGVEQYQIVQEDYENIVIKIVPGKDLHKDINEIRKFMAEEYRKILGEGMNIDVVIVEQINPTAAGKRRFIVSKIAQL